MKVQIDGDVIVYEAGFASDAAQKARNELRLAEGKDIGPEHEPLAFALTGVDMKIKSIKKITDAEDIQIWISHPVNYREQWFPAYKQNRNVLHKPFWYQEIQDYLIEDLGAIYSEKGDEADDAMGIAQTADIKNSLIATKDKDLDLIPGWHYNWSPTKKDDGVYYISPQEASFNFYSQLISGDTTDNIPGIYHWSGKKQKATKDLFAGLSELQGDREMYEYILSLYKGDAAHIYNIAQLLWIKREQVKTPGGKPWNPPT